MKKFYPILFIFFTFVIFTSCKTSGRLVENEKLRRNYQDPSGVKTIETEIPTNTKTNAAREEELSREVDVLKGKVEEKDYKISQLEANLASLKTELEAKKSAPVPTPPKPEENNSAKGRDLLWKLVKEDLHEKKYENSILSLKELSQGNKKDLSRSKAIQTLGMVYYQLGQWKESALEFNRMLEEYPKATWALQAWYGQGLAFAQAGQYQEAELFFDEVIERAPKSQEAKVAKSWKSLKHKKSAKLTKDLFSEYPNWIKSL